MILKFTNYDDINPNLKYKNTISHTKNDVRFYMVRKVTTEIFIMLLLYASKIRHIF